MNDNNIDILNSRAYTRCCYHVDGVSHATGYHPGGHYTVRRCMGLLISGCFGVALNHAGYMAQGYNRGTAVMVAGCSQQPPGIERKNYNFDILKGRVTFIDCIKCVWPGQYYEMIQDTC